MNAIRQTCVPSLVLLAVLISVGCSEREAGNAAEPISTEPLVMATPAEKPSPAAIRTDAGGIPSTYTPYFEDGRLLRIAEERESNAPLAGHAEYYYRGARLIRYAGPALRGEGRLNLEFDLRGALLSARNADGPVADDEVTAVRGRAQLLRSHALAQQATRMHRKEADGG